MSIPIQLTLDASEVEILVDALEADLEDYIESAKEAGEEGSREQAQTFAEAATQVESVLRKVRAAVPE
jgi:hypothetical protein